MMSVHEKKITRGQQAAIAALLSNTTINAAADAAKVHERTIYRWLNDSSFQAAYKDARKHIVSQAMARVQAAMTTAVDALEAVMNDPIARASARVAAARAIIDMGLKAAEILDLEERISGIEKKISGRKTWP